MVSLIEKVRLIVAICNCLLLVANRFRQLGEKRRFMGDFLVHVCRDN